MKVIYLLMIFLLLPSIVSCSWLGYGEEDPYEGMTEEEEFQARNQQSLSKDVNINRDQYLQNMQHSQKANTDPVVAKPRDFAIVRQKVSNSEYKRIQAQAELGDEDSCYQMGVIHKYGYFTGKPNLVAARRWFEEAANLGSIKARHQLNYMDRSGRLQYQR